MFLCVSLLSLAPLPFLPRAEHVSLWYRFSALFRSLFFPERLRSEPFPGPGTSAWAHKPDVPAADEKPPALRIGASDLPDWLFALLDQTGFVEAVAMLVSRPYADPQVFACVQKILWLVRVTLNLNLGS
jgi:hypothetical protein